MILYWQFVNEKSKLSIYIRKKILKVLKKKLKTTRICFVDAWKKMYHGEEYYVTVTAINTVDMTSNAFSGAVGVDLTPPKAGMVVDLSSVYRIDASSTDHTVSMNAKICATEEGLLFYCIAVR